MGITVTGTQKVSDGAILYRGQVSQVTIIPRLGDSNYLDYVDREARKAGESWRADINQILIGGKGTEIIKGDIEAEKISSKYSDIKDIPYAKPGDPWRVVCLQFNKYVAMGNAVNKDLHYFRNKLNRYPKTLDLLLDAQKDGDQWELYIVSKSIFHMQPSTESGNGLKNLKFVCRDKIYEAVYNHNRKALHENNDPLNMGTYNYGAAFVPHTDYDVLPYYSFGNTGDDDVKLHPDSESRYDYSKSWHIITDEKKKNDSEDAIKYREGFIEKEWLPVGGIGDE